MAAGFSGRLFSSIFAFMTKRQKTAAFLTASALCFILACRLSKPLADFYALHLYPAISSALSRLASFTAYSLTEVTILSLILWILVLWGLVLSRRMRAGRALWGTVLILTGAMAWLYMGWGINYFRSDLYSRRHVQASSFSKEALMDYLEWYSQALNDNLSKPKTASTGKAALEEELRRFYLKEGPISGLCVPQNWQHPKRLLLEDLYAGVGVLGYVGPFFAEHQVSGKLLDMEYPFTLAHEYAHVLGVSEEAEANYWGFVSCMASQDPGVRYSALQGILTQTLSTARAALDDQAYRKWMKTLPPRAIEDLKARQQHWRGLYWPLLGSIQEKAYDLFLKGNQVKGGMANYNRAISMILTFEKDRMAARR